MSTEERNGPDEGSKGVGFHLGKCEGNGTLEDAGANIPPKALRSKSGSGIAGIEREDDGERDKSSSRARRKKRSNSTGDMDKVVKKSAEEQRKRKKEASVGGSWGSGGSRVVRLNVGGVLYYTTEETLTQQGRLHNGNEHAAQENYFSSLLSGRIATLKDESGAYFIDRDGDLFRPILSYLRTGRIVVPPTVPYEYELCFLHMSVLRSEAEYYCIDLPPVLAPPPHVRKDGLYVAWDTEHRRLISMHFLPALNEPTSLAMERDVSPSLDRRGRPIQMATSPPSTPTSPLQIGASLGQRVKIKMTTTGTHRFNDTNLTCMRRYENVSGLVATVEEDDPSVGFRAVVLPDGIETVEMKGYPGFKSFRFRFFQSAPPLHGQVYKYSHGRRTAFDGFELPDRLVFEEDVAVALTSKGLKRISYQLTASGLEDEQIYKINMPSLPNTISLGSRLLWMDAYVQGGGWCGSVQGKCGSDPNV